jgi:hypothetical protein
MSTTVRKLVYLAVAIGAAWLALGAPVNHGG